MTLSELKQQIEDFIAVFGDVDLQGEPSVQPYKPTSDSPIKAQIWDLQEHWDDEAVEEDYDDSMDGDHDSAMASAGWGTDEDYGYYGEY